MVEVIEQKSIFQKVRDKFHSLGVKNTIGLAFVLVIGVGFITTYALLGKQQDIRQHAADSTASEYGFNTHLNTTGTGNGQNLTLDFFHKTVDDLVAHQQQWIRFNIIPGDSASLSPGTNTFTWNQANLQKYDDAISYAKSKGLKVSLVTSTPDFASYFSPSDYTATTTQYHSYLASRYKGKIDVWQIFNEADTKNYKSYPAPPLGSLTDPYPANYLTDLKTNIDAAKNAIKAVDPNVQIAANVTGFPIGQNLYSKWAMFFDAIAPSVDILSFDLYPQNASETSTIGSAVTGIAGKWLKPFIIAETGTPTGSGTFTEQNQVDLLSGTLGQVRDLNPKAVFFYEYSDTLPNTNPTESSFGIVKADGIQKSSYAPVMQLMRAQTGLLRVQTNPAADATITVTSLTTNQIVSTTEWSVQWISFPTGNYKISYSNPKNFLFSNGLPPKLPQDSYLTIFTNQTTTVLADMNAGTQTISPPPVGIPTPIPTPSGLLRVQTSPAAGVTITVTSLSTNQVASTTTWSVQWINLLTGNYKISYSNPNNFLLTGGAPPKLPPDNFLTIFTNQTTTVLADMNAGTQTISPTPVGIPATPTPIPSTGLLRVQTAPATQSMITVTNQSGIVKFHQLWSIDWLPIDNGTYTVTFSNPGIKGTITPGASSFSINPGRVTEIIADFTSGKTTINYH